MHRCLYNTEFKNYRREAILAALLVRSRRMKISIFIEYKEDNNNIVNSCVKSVKMHAKSLFVHNLRIHLLACVDDNFNDENEWKFEVIHPMSQAKTIFFCFFSQSETKLMFSVLNFSHDPHSQITNKSKINNNKNC